jgi:hypothetical protein
MNIGNYWNNLLNQKENQLWQVDRCDMWTMQQIGMSWRVLSLESKKPKQQVEGQ